MIDRRKILQIMAAEPGWYARYDAGPDEPRECQRVILWASVRDILDNDESYDHVIPIVPADGNYPMPADYTDKYAGVTFQPTWKAETAWEEPA